MNKLTKTRLAVLLIGIIGAGGIATVAQASFPQRISNTFIAQKMEDEKEINEEQEMEEDEKLEEQQEAARLQPLAKITATQAKESALKVQSGEVTELELEAENGNLVYEVTVGETEVFVDAGNGKVLYTQGVNEKVDDATEQTRPRSSIQVPNQDNNE